MTRGPIPAAELDRLERLARRMDAAFRIPLTRIRVGWDSILGLLPGVGDAAALAPAGYILWRARRNGAPLPLMLRMGANTGLDWVIGLVPLLGDLFDVGFKSNQRNVALLREYSDRQAGIGHEKGRASAARPSHS